MNTLICKKCKRLWIPEIGSTCPKCGGALMELKLNAEQVGAPVPEEIRLQDLSKRLVTFDERKTS